jgi:hypothetical protein
MPAARSWSFGWCSRHPAVATDGIRYDHGPNNSNRTYRLEHPSPRRRNVTPDPVPGPGSSSPI